ncbi:unnamed protein product, partial [marine sediment metagenome]
MKNIVKFSEISKKDIKLVGGKGANLGELKKAKVSVPDGFCVTVQAYYDFIKKHGILDLIKSQLKDLDPENTKKLNVVSRKIKKRVLAAKIDPKLQDEIKKAYSQLGAEYVAVRSSATAEDLP